MTQILEQIKSYQQHGNIQLSRDGSQATLSVKADGHDLELTITLEHDRHTDDVEIESIEVECYDDDNNDVDVSYLDIEAMVIEIFSKPSNDTWSKSYIAIKDDYLAEFA